MKSIFMQNSISDDAWNRIFDNGTLIYEEFIGKDNPEKAFYSRDGIAKYTYNGELIEKERATALTVFREIEKMSKQDEKEH